jgi:phosphoglucosamine mutase
MEEMLKGDYNLGGEQSGHLIFRESATTGDGILAALQLLKIMTEEQIKMSDLRKCMERLPQVLKNVHVKNKVPLEELPELSASIAKMEDRLGKAGRILFRYSGTESVARIMVEGQEPEEIEAIADDLCEQTVASIAKYKGNA